MVFAPTRSDVWPRRTRIVWAVFASIVLAVAVVFVLIRQETSSPSGAQITGSGVAAAEARPLPHFSGVAVAVGARVKIYAADKAVAVVRTDDNLVERITTRVRRGVLILGSVGRFTTRTPLTIAIGTPQLDAVTVTHGGSVRLQNIRGRRLTVTLSGLGGAVRGGGAVDRLEVALHTVGNAQPKVLPARDVHAVLSGSGQIVVTAMRKLDATLSGSGAIVYYGNPPQVRKIVLGSGSVTPG